MVKLIYRKLKYIIKGKYISQKNKRKRYSRNQMIKLSKKTVLGFRHLIFSNGCTT
jgi:hypothetical protein